ncbi:HEAT repeat domain-containing protein [Candidatus Villigracilis affinis]|uniref:HEAT repeat domain-containing protein n=2 Tax=Candidatus Villigracilis affinis TaxID=3140682 RepID=UPI001E18DF6E|nr:HEAT repeat domain-containing protein [Anaerolineales bacterium]
MDWLTGSKQGESKKLISQLADSTKRDAAAQGLMKLGAEAVPALMEALQTQDLSLLLIYQHVLARMPSAQPQLTKALASAHPVIRGRIIEVFGISKDKALIPVLLDALKSEYFTVRSKALLALAAIGDERTVPDLLPLLKDPEDEVRIAACAAIGKFRDPSTFDEITNVLLDDLKIEVRQAAAKALGETKHPAAIPFLMEALRDSFWWYEKEQAVSVLLTAIENMGEAVVEPLIDALADKEGTVRKFAAMILSKLGDIRAIEELGMALYDLHHEVGEAAAEALTKFGSQAVDILIESLSHPEAAIREHAVVALGKIQDVRVAPVLIEMLRDPDRDVQKNAMFSLVNLRDERAIPALREIAENRADREMSMLAKQLLSSS